MITMSWPLFVFACSASLLWGFGLALIIMGGRRR
jgi:hypothetical protein